MNEPESNGPVQQASVFSQSLLVQKLPSDVEVRRQQEPVERLQLDIDSNDEYFPMFHGVQAVQIFIKIVIFVKIVVRQSDKNIRQGYFTRDIIFWCQKILQ